MFYDQNLVTNLAMSEVRDGTLITCDEIGKAIYNLIEKRAPSDPLEFPILSLDGLTASKSSYRSLEEFACGLFLPNEYNDSARLISFETDEDFKTNIKYFESNLGRDRLIYHRGWDGKYFILNTGGSHHLAAVYRQCKDQGRRYNIKCRIEEHTLNHKNCCLVLDKYYPLIVGDSCKNRLSSILHEFGINCRMVKLLGSCGLIYLPKGSPMSEIVYEYLKKLGAVYVFDLYSYLKDLLASPRDVYSVARPSSD